MTRLYEIKNWAKVYEKSDHRKCATLQWVSTPTDLSSLGRLKIMAQPNGFEILGVWDGLVALAANAPRTHRGKLVSSDFEPYSIEDMALKTRGSADVLARCIPVLVEIGWLVVRETAELECASGDDVVGEAPSGDSPETFRRVSGGLPEPSGPQDRTLQDKKRGKTRACARETPFSPQAASKTGRDRPHRAEPLPDEAPEGVCRTWNRLWQAEHGTGYVPSAFCYGDGVRLGTALDPDQVDLVEPAMRSFLAAKESRGKGLNEFCRVAGGLIAAAAKRRREEERIRAARTAAEEARAKPDDLEPSDDEGWTPEKAARLKAAISGIGSAIGQERCPT